MMTTFLILGPFLLVWAIAALFYALGRRRAKQVRFDEITSRKVCANGWRR